MSSQLHETRPGPASPTPINGHKSSVEHGPQRIVPRWHLHRRLYDWVLSWAHHPHGTWALFLLSFAESSFFPVPPDVLQIALTLERRERAWWYALVSSVASVLGGLAGYLIGYLLWGALERVFFDYVPGFTPDVFEKVKSLYQEYDFLIIFVAAFTPIPYKVFTITGGVAHLFLPTFLLASAIGRAGRFFLVAALLWKFGRPMKTFIEKYFNILTLVLAVILAIVVVLFKVL